MFRLLFTALFAGTLIGCGDSPFWDSSCKSEMNEIRGKMGEPEEVNTYNSGDYSKTDWWYWTRGIQYSFTYYKYCEVSTYTFRPLR